MSAMQQTIATPSTNGKGPQPPGSPPSKRFEPRLAYIIGGSVLLVVLGVLLFLRFQAPATTPLVTAPVQRQALVAYATATGTVNPQDTINIGSQVSGTISTLDVDYNSKVRAGQVLARLDPTPFQAALAVAQGSLAQAQAQAAAAGDAAAGSGSSAQAALATARAAQATKAAAQQSVLVADAAVRSADADVAKAKSALALANQTLARSRGLLAQGYVSQSQVDSDTSAQIAANAALSSAEAAAQQSRAQALAARSQATASAEQSVSQTAQSAASVTAVSGSNSSAAAAQAAVAVAEAHVVQAQLDLDHTVIKSPVDGTVISRTVSVGQTVAASFQTPTLFTIAKDLRKMEVDLAVGEPDVGSVKVGQAVDFSVLAYPGQTFHGTISQVRQNGTVVSNVVTYTTPVLVDNTDGRLRPGMTANASVHVGKTADDALVVPISALSWRPPAALRPARTQVSSSPAGSATAVPGAAGSSPWGNVGSSGAGALVAGSRSRLFVENADGSVRAVPVTVTLVSGSSAAVQPSGASLAPGDLVVVSGGTSASGSNSSAGRTGSSALTPATVRVPGGGGGGR